MAPCILEFMRTAQHKSPFCVLSQCKQLAFTHSKSDTGAYLKDSIVNCQDRNIKGTATKIED